MTARVFHQKNEAEFLKRFTQRNLTAPGWAF